METDFSRGSAMSHFGEHHENNQRSNIVPKVTMWLDVMFLLQSTDMLELFSSSVGLIVFFFFNTQNKVLLNIDLRNI